MTGHRSGPGFEVWWLRLKTSGMASESDIPRPPNVVVDLAAEDLVLLRAGLQAYLERFAAHRAEDNGASHPPQEWVALQRRVGHLMWTLEVAGAPPGARITHSHEAVDPGE